jgi:aminomethyltransferase
MGRRTPLYDAHVAGGARIVDFAGWDMPVHYGSQIQEHHSVRGAAGMFDVSHMCIVDLSGEGATDLLRRLLANDVARLEEPGRALYTCMLNERGGVIDDLIVYYLGPGAYRAVVNAGTRDKDLAWIRAHTPGTGVDVAERTDLAMIAVQGPKARDLAHPLLPAELGDAAPGLRRFAAASSGDWMVARTGYTGEDGYELMVPATEAPDLWRRLLEAGVRPVGLGARDTLRLEAGMNLYGHDMDEDTTPLESGLAWTVAWDPAERDFIGRPALEAQREAGVPRALRGLMLDGKGVLRDGMPVHTAAGEGVVTSGSFAPTLEASIALARLPTGAGDRVEVEMRGRRVPAHVVRPPFVREGRARV